MEALLNSVLIVALVAYTVECIAMTKVAILPVSMLNLCELLLNCASFFDFLYEVIEVIYLCIKFTKIRLQGMNKFERKMLFSFSYWLVMGVDIFYPSCTM